jgi:exodeoxyribonuclease III
MKLATYNVNGINGRLPVLIRWLAQSEPDVVCLQELKSSDEKFPVEALERAGYGAIWHGQKVGMALRSWLVDAGWKRLGEDCPGIPMILTADTLRRSLMAC